MHRHTFVPAEHNSTTIREADFADCLSRAEGPMPLIVEIQQLSRKRQLHQVLCNRRRPVLEDCENLRARVHAVDRFRVLWKPLPDHLGRFGRLF